MAINKLLIVLVSYELTNNFRIKEAGKWLNKEKIIDISDLEKFHEKALYRTLEILKSNERENPP
jgi:transposase